MPERTLVDVRYDRFCFQTDKGGMLFIIDGNKVWLPKSVIEVDWRAKVITLPETMAIEKGIDGSVIT